MVKILSHLVCVFIAEVEQGHLLPSGVSSHALNKCPFCGLFSGTLSAYLCFLLVTSLLKMSPKYGAAVLSGTPKHRKAGMCLRERTLDKLRSGMS